MARKRNRYPAVPYPSKDECSCGGTLPHNRSTGVSIDQMCPDWMRVHRENNRRNMLALGRERAEASDLVSLLRLARTLDQLKRRIKNAEVHRPGA